MSDGWRVIGVDGQAALVASVEERVAAAIASQTDEHLITTDNYAVSARNRRA